MVELGVQVKLSARKMSLADALKKINNVRVYLIVAAAIFFVLGVCETVVVVMKTTAILAT